MNELRRFVFSGLAFLLFSLFLLTPSALAQSDGEWYGTTNEGRDVFFRVNGNNVDNFQIEICVYGGSGSPGGCFEEYIAFSLPISGNNFTFSSLQFDLTGTFTSSETCTGTWAFRDGFLGYGSGTWYASFPASPKIELFPLSHNFGDQLVGTSSSIVAFTLTNKGGGTATGSISLTDANSDQFEITSGGGSFSLSHGQSKEVDVRFMPTSTGLSTATLIVDGDSPCNDASASLAGVGTYPILSVTPHYQIVLADSGSTTFSVSNAGSSTMSWTAAVDPTDTWMTIASGSSGTNSGTITVTYEANDGDARRGSITVAADGADNSPQTIELFQTANNSVKLTAGDGAASDWLGNSVSMSGDYLIVGAYGDDDKGSDSGSAYVFERTEIGWIERAKLTASDGASGDNLGWSVIISGDYVIVGAPGDDSAAGSAYLFAKPEGGWTDMTETAKLTASDRTASDSFGRSVSISGDYAIVGAPGDDDKGSGSGSAYLFAKPEGGWTDMTETAKLTASDGYGHIYLVSDYFGTSVSISGEYVIVGASGDDTAAGSAYLFAKPQDGWADMTETHAAGANSYDGAYQELS